MAELQTEDFKQNTRTFHKNTTTSIIQGRWEGVGWR